MKLEEHLILTVADHLGIESNTVSLNSHLVRDLGLNSFDQVLLAAEVEEAFQIDLPAVLPDVVRVKDYLRYIHAAEEELAKA